MWSCNLLIFCSSSLTFPSSWTASVSFFFRPFSNLTLSASTCSSSSFMLWVFDSLSLMHFWTSFFSVIVLLSSSWSWLTWSARALYSLSLLCLCELMMCKSCSRRWSLACPSSCSAWANSSLIRMMFLSEPSILSL